MDTKQHYPVLYHSESKAAGRQLVNHFAMFCSGFLRQHLKKKNLSKVIGPNCKSCFFFFWDNTRAWRENWWVSLICQQQAWAWARAPGQALLCWLAAVKRTPVSGRFVSSRKLKVRGRAERRWWVFVPQSDPAAASYWQQVQSCSRPTSGQSLWQSWPYLAACFWYRD